MRNKNPISSVTALLVITTLSWGHTTKANADDTLILGYSPSIQLLGTRVNDRDSEQKGFLLPFGIAARYQIDRTSDLFFSLDYIDELDFGASATDVGQEVSGTSLSVIWRSTFALSRSLKPRFGIGLAFDQLEYTNRFTVDSDGFLLERLPDEDDPQIGILLNASIPFAVGRDSRFELDFIYKIPLDDGLQSIGARLTYYPEFLRF